MQFQVTFLDGTQKVVTADGFGWSGISSSGVVVNFTKKVENPEYIPPSRRNEIPLDPDEPTYDPDNYFQGQRKVEVNVAIFANVLSVEELEE